MPSFWVLAAIIVPTVAIALFIRRMTHKFDAVLLMISGAASLVLAAAAARTMQVEQSSGMMVLEMTQSSFHLAVLPPVVIVATLTVMRGIFKFLGE